jgi:hypothetical protein
MTQPTLFDAPATIYARHRQELAAEDRRLASAADRVLAALEAGPQTNLTLIAICQRISGRIYDLRKRGYVIEVEPLEPGIFRYTLRGRTTEAT